MRRRRRLNSTAADGRAAESRIAGIWLLQSHPLGAGAFAIRAVRRPVHVGLYGAGYLEVSLFGSARRRGGRFNRLADSRRAGIANFCVDRSPDPFADYPYIHGAFLLELPQQSQARSRLSLGVSRAIIAKL